MIFRESGISISNSEKLSLISNLATMLAAGIPLVEIVDSMLEGAKGGSGVILKKLRDDLNQGKTISESFGKFPRVFSAVIVNLIKAAEEAGTLEQTLKDIVENLKKDIEFSDKIKAALVYPILVSVVFLGVMILILTFVIPRVSDVFARLHVNLPLPTKILITLSNFILAYTFLAIGLVIAVIILIIFLFKTKRKLILNLIFKMPLISQLAREIDLTRFTRTMSLLLNSGIPITEALELSAQVINLHAISSMVADSKEAVTGGKKLSEGFKIYKKLVPVVMIRITEAGEKSGTLEESMTELSDYFDLRVTSSIKSLTNLFEPILLIIIGLMVGGVMLAIIAPIYGLIGQIQVR